MAPMNQRQKEMLWRQHDKLALRLGGLDDTETKDTHDAGLDNVSYCTSQHDKVYTVNI